MSDANLWISEQCLLGIKGMKEEKKNDIIINLEAPRSRFQDIIQGKLYYMD